MAATIAQANVTVFHDDAAATGACTIQFTLSVNGQPFQVPIYTQDDIGLTVAQKAQLDTLLTLIRASATTKLKADMAGLV